MKLWTSIFSLMLAVCFAGGAIAQSVSFGDDNGEYANDGECDERRFMGWGSASTLDRSDNYKDATDCETLYRGGMIWLVDKDAGIAATQCDAIDFGDNTSEWANDDECDDPRFDGPGTASGLALVDLFKDAKDCSAQCAEGNIWLRVRAP